MNGALLSYILQQQAKMPSELDLIRQLERLEALIPHNKMEDLLPAFHYTVEQLSNYIVGENNNVKRQYYIDLFERCLQMLKTSQKTKPKTKKLTTQNAIMNEIMAKMQDCKLGVSNPIKQHKKNIQNQQLSAQQSSQFHKILKQIHKYYEEHNLDSCHISIAKLSQLQEKYPDQAVFKTSKISDQINSIQKEYQKMIQFYKHFDDQEDWIFDKQENDVRMQYRVYEREKTIAVRINALLDMEMLPFLAIACEIDLQKEYVPFVQVSKLDAEIARNKRVGYSRTSVPIIADRECYFYAVGYDRTKNQTCKSIFIFTESYEDNLQLRNQHKLQLDKDLQKQKKTLEEKVLLKVHYFCLQYIPLSPNKAKVRLVTKADFKMSYLPLFILQRAARIFASDYFSSIVERAKKYKDSQWEKKVQQNPTMYNFFQEKIDQFFRKKS